MVRAAEKKDMCGLDARTTLLDAYDVMAQTGIGYHNALALIKVHGVKFGKRGYRISAAALARALDPKGGNDDDARTA